MRSAADRAISLVTIRMAATRLQLSRAQPAGPKWTVCLAVCLVLWPATAECRAFDFSYLPNSNKLPFTPSRGGSQSQFYEHLQDVLLAGDRAQEPSEGISDAWQPPTEIEEAVDWPTNPALQNLGQVPGVDVDHEGRVHLFHRGDTIWDSGSFDGDNVYLHRDRGPIANHTVLVLDPKTGDILERWGQNRFYMPHGLTLDAKGNTWLTDVALHQVFKFEPGKEAPSLVLGEAFVPGKDGAHFCKPTDVAVASSGIFFVSDGYCNSRVLVFSPEGKLLGTIGDQDGMVVPHSLTLLEKADLLCVADRENRRVLCYTAGLAGTRPGQLQLVLRHPQLGKVFAIDHIGDVLFAVNGPDTWTARGQRSVRGVTFDLGTEAALTTWKPVKGFDTPHDLAISPDGTAMYVVEIGASAPKKIYKFHLIQL